MSKILRASEPTEHQEQAAFFKFIEQVPWRGGIAPGSMLRDYCFAVPNAGTVGGKRGLLAGKRRKDEGVTAGVSDIECMIPRNGSTGLFIEMKRASGTNSDVSDAQLDFMSRARHCGRQCVVAFGAKDAWQKLATYLGIPST